MNKLIIIGNGFDLAHGLLTSYKDFMNWYFEQWRERLIKSHKKIERDELCRFWIKQHISWIDSFYYNNLHVDGLTFIKRINDIKKSYKITLSPFLSKILDSIETKGWVDIENDYYDLLCSYAQERKNVEVKILNCHLSFLKGKLVEYLKSIDKKRNHDGNIMHEILIPIEKREIAVHAREYCDNLDVEGIMLLDFNYTTTTSLYCDDKNIIHIHGELANEDNVIFGYGDEMDDRLKDIMRLNDNEYLTNIKSVRYCETNSYKRMLAFMESGYFQVCIMGHSCGISDRTLLNTIFEHKKCVSIKPHYHRDSNGNENYSDIIRNIYRNFNNPSLMRDRVVSKEYSNLFG